MIIFITIGFIIPLIYLLGQHRGASKSLKMATIDIEQLINGLVEYIIMGCLLFSGFCIGMIVRALTT